MGLKEAANRLGICPTTLKVDTLAGFEAYLLLSFCAIFPCGLDPHALSWIQGILHVQMRHWVPDMALASMTALAPLMFYGFCQDSSYLQGNCCSLGAQRACRRHGIQRWPRRQLLKLSRAIDQINATGTLKNPDGTTADGEAPCLPLCAWVLLKECP